jgi:hypothetical protein
MASPFGLCCRGCWGAASWIGCVLRFDYTARPPPPVVLPAAAGASLCLGGASRRASPCGLARPPAVLSRRQIDQDSPPRQSESSVCAVFLVIAFLIPVAGCGDGGTQGPPKRVRSCGELEGVTPVEPVVAGQDALGCPVFAPVPCTKEAAEYDSVCGPDCSPAISTGANGDTWLLGCETRGPATGCVGDFHETYCGIDPFEGEVYWWGMNECDPFFIYFLDCWESCDGDREPTQVACL